MYGKTLSLLAALFILSLGIGFFVWQTSHATEKTYKNTVYGYSLSYPPELDAKEYTDDDTVFGIVSKDAVDGRAEARVITAQREVGQTVQDAVADQLKNLCAADGPNGSFSCTDTLSTEPFTTDAGEMGFVLMLKGEMKDLKTGITTQIPKGPYYLLTIADTATIAKVVVIAPPLNLSAAEADDHLVQTIAQSVTLTK